MEIQIILALAALGCCTGFLAGLLGIGGGMVLTPFLTLLLGYAGIPIEHIVHVAIATSMGTILFTSLSSVRAHAKRGAVLWNVVFSMAPGILVGAVVGAQVSGALPTFWVALIFAVFVYTSAAKMFLNAKPTPSRHLPGPAGMFGAGTAIGVISALVGAGGGFISVPFMTWCNVRCLWLPHRVCRHHWLYHQRLAFDGTARLALHHRLYSSAGPCLCRRNEHLFCAVRRKGRTLD